MEEEVEVDILRCYAETFLRFEKSRFLRKNGKFLLLLIRALESKEIAAHLFTIHPDAANTNRRREKTLSLAMRKVIYAV